MCSSGRALVDSLPRVEGPQPREDKNVVTQKTVTCKADIIWRLCGGSKDLSWQRDTLLPPPPRADAILEAADRDPFYCSSHREGFREEKMQIQQLVTATEWNEEQRPP
uniref:Uncharacterized protein n=1 Tax=Knipowitschia caucasica TaxID=637954 RepID=A0AAV2LSX7_KNICA